MTRNRLQGRRTERLARAQVETGVMPGTTHGLPDHEALRERPE